MRLFYGITLVSGLFLTAFVLLVTVAIPKDAFVASVLSRHPEDWSLSVGSGLQERLSHYDIKSEAATALGHRANYREQLDVRELGMSVVIAVFSLVGFWRESRMRKETGKSISRRS